MSLPEQPISPEAPTICRTARFEVAASQSSTTVVTAHGELDAANAQHFADFALRHAQKSLILDLSYVEFFGTAGFSALHTLNVRCAGSDIDWVLVPSAAVSRLLRICDPDATLPSSETVEKALALLQGEPRPLLQLVAEPR
ncbi:STAS domain-containing protein [Mycolicibacterium litorale]|uniref:Sulfate transporter n=1 Tax=Mycolicibacterium litorale TaxID=758802 RepID=A0AAD1IKT4_9MYCO|nr:STAS domain-containing protein [Mycolicibacterium litorale]TDY09330.1 anti-sigma-factor antagonist [Mycolicibacterium litorale]BBY17274.1 sulfate transporter [Mycolicibacterium litorale]